MMEIQRGGDLTVCVDYGCSPGRDARTDHGTNHRKFPLRGSPLKNVFL
jgi:hypothetical protein